MSQQTIPEGKAILLEPASKVGALLIRVDKLGWVKRQISKLAAPIAAFVAGYFARHGGQEHAEVIAAGAAALFVFLAEAGWSWLVFKANHQKIANALETPAAIPKAEQPDWIQPPTEKRITPRTVGIGCLVFFLCAASASACRAYQPPTRYVPYGEPELTADGRLRLMPEWEVNAREAAREVMRARYSVARRSEAQSGTGSVGPAGSRRSQGDSVARRSEARFGKDSVGPAGSRRSQGDSAKP